ncbi:MAG: PqqD family peptide modification chaperone [Betaproteobacteria bacterium]|nr:MAG: PqqD family peptide modification chaperone [Betaproteobacteria bacterium]
MAQQLLSPAWYRVANLRPRLRLHVRVRRHEYRGQRWHVIEDRISRRTHRLDPMAYFVVGLMNGERSLQAIWDAAAQRFGDEAPTQDEVIRLLGQLHIADVLQSEVTPDVNELLRRSQRIRGRTRLAKALSPLAIRFPLFDPDALLERWLPLFRPLFGPLGALLWLCVAGWGGIMVFQHWGELTQDVTDRILAPENLLLATLVFAVLKALHEFGHACAVKAWGGEVHEMGIMLLVLFPIPYVDASAASAFPERHRRMVVGAAGMLVETFLASIAMFFWLNVEPGLTRAALFNAIWISGVSTLLFNANPLLRFDGYYILSDWLEIPNLYQRAGQFVGALAERRLFRMDTPLPETTPRERGWLIFYLIGSFCYRLFISLSIALFIAAQYFLVGVVLAFWAVVAALVLPILRLIAYLAWHPRLRRHRTRAALTTAVVAATILGVVFLVPVPVWTNAQGVTWMPEQSAVRAGADGHLVRVIARPGTPVRRGDALVEIADPVIPPQVQMLEAQKTELEARYQAERQDNQTQAQQTLDQIESVAASLARMRERAAELVVRSPEDGVFIVPTAQDLPDRFVRHGEPIGYVIAEARSTARVLVPQDSIDLVRSRTQQVRAKLAENLQDVVAARVLREVPAASDRLPNPALSQAGGGVVALDPQAARDMKALRTHFEFEIELLAAPPAGRGGRVYVRFEHGTEPIAQQLYRSVRQLFLRRFTV